MSSDTPHADKTSRRKIFAPTARAKNAAEQSIVKTLRQRRRRQILQTSAVIASLLVLAILINNAINDQDATSSFQIGQVRTDLTGSIVVEGVSYQGVTREGNFFTFSAEQALESNEHPNEVQVVLPRAEIYTESGLTAKIHSERGVFMRDNNIARLVGDVVIDYVDLGYRLTSDEVIAELNSGLIYSEAGIEGEIPEGSIRADGMVLENIDDSENRRVIFSGHTVLTFTGGNRQN